MYGLEFTDQPVLAIDRVRYQGEAVALVAADHPETARRAAELIRVDYELLEPVTDAGGGAGAGRPGRARGREPGAARADPPRRSDCSAADVVVAGEYEVGMQDQAFLGPESGLAVPDGEGGVDIYVATQWLHVDRDQVAPCLGLAREQVRITLAGVGGAFGGREDLSMQIHACLLALHTGKPVKIVYTREESFFGHVHRHPAALRYAARRHPGRPARLRAGAILLDGGAYASSSTAVVRERGLLRLRPVRRAERA